MFPAKWGPGGALCLDTPRYVDLDEVLTRRQLETQTMKPATIAPAQSPLIGAIRYL